MNFRLDKTVFKQQTAEEADNHLAYWQTKTHTERLDAAMYLIYCAYNIDINNPPKMDKNFFSKRKNN